MSVTWSGPEGSRFNLTLADERVVAFEPGQEVAFEDLPAEFTALSKKVQAAFEVRTVAEVEPEAPPAEPEAAATDPAPEGGEAS